MRGRTLIVASSWIGSASSSSASVTIEVSPSPRSTFSTLPTSTPAIRTGERGPSSFACRTTARSSHLSLHGAPLNASQHAQNAIAIARSPAAKFEIRCGWLRFRGALIRRPPRQAGRVASVVAPWSPGTLPIRWPGSHGSLPASHSPFSPQCG